jgi:aspartate/methionine/tyrosine aminotransferase
MGMVVGAAPLCAALVRVKSYLDYGAFTPVQVAAIAALNGPQDAVEEMRRAFDRRRRTIVTMLNDIEGIVCPTPLGAFYAYPSVKGLLRREHGGVRIDTSAQLAEYILDKAEVAAVPGEAFGSPGYLRFSYALSDNDIVEGITRLQKLFA